MKKHYYLKLTVTFFILVLYSYSSRAFVVVCPTEPGRNCVTICDVSRCDVCCFTPANGWKCVIAQEGDCIGQSSKTQNPNNYIIEINGFKLYFAETSKGIVEFIGSRPVPQKVNGIESANLSATIISLENVEFYFIFEPSINSVTLVHVNTTETKKEEVINFYQDNPIKNEKYILPKGYNYLNDAELTFPIDKNFQDDSYKFNAIYNGKVILSVPLRAGLDYLNFKTIIYQYLGIESINLIRYNITTHDNKILYKIPNN